MKHLFKKNQIIITTLAVMIAIAGYLNYSGKLFSDDPNSSAEANTEMVIRSFWIFQRKIWRRKVPRSQARIPKSREHRGRQS